MRKTEPHVSIEREDDAFKASMVPLSSKLFSIIELLKLSPEHGIIMLQGIAADLAKLETVRKKGVIRNRRYLARKQPASYDASYDGQLTPPEIPHQNTEKRHMTRHMESPSLFNLTVTKKERAAKSRPLSPDWVPSENDLQFAKSRGFTREDINLIAERFRNHWLGNGKCWKSWEHVWRNWILKENPKINASTDPREILRRSII